MIRTLFSKQLLIAFACLLFVGGIANGQTTVLTTSYTGAVQHTYGTSASGVSHFISFDVQNDNLCPVKLTSVSMWHPGLLAFSSGLNLSCNDSTYTLYYSGTKTSGAPTPLTSANGWTQGPTSAPVNTGTTNGVTPIFSNLNIVIPSQSKMRFVVYTNDTIVWAYNATPLSFNANNIILTSGSATEVWTGEGISGPSQNTTNFTTPPTSLNFDGSIVLEQLPPNPPSVSTNPVSGTVCVGDSVIVNATYTQPGAEFVLRNPSGNILATNTTGKFSVTNLTAAKAGNYTVTVRLCNKESNPAIVRINVNDPAPPGIDGKVAYCINDPFIPVTVVGTNPKWYYTPTGGSPIPVTPTINTASPNVLFFYVSQTDQYGCESATRTEVKLSVATKPEPPVVNTPQYFCENEPADQLRAVGDTLKWYYQQSGGIPTAIAPTPNTSKRDSFQYWVSQTIDGCESERTQMDVVVTFKPNGLIVVEKEIICANDSFEISYYGSAFPTAAYNWQMPPGTNLLNGGLDQGPIKIQLTQAGKQIIKLQVGNTGCYSDLYIEDVVVKPLPTGTINMKDDLCVGQADLIFMETFTKTTDTFMWDFDGGATTHYTTDQGPFGVFWGQEGWKHVKVTLFDEGCAQLIVDSTLVHAKPDATIIAEVFDPNNMPQVYTPGEEVCQSDSVKVSARTVEVRSKYTWTPARFFDAAGELPVTYAVVDDATPIQLHVVDEWGCENTDSITIKTKSCCEMWFPSAFSPNNDGTNDYFKPQTLGTREVKTFKVINRYGQVVYESRGYRNGWDGTMNGKALDIGTYHYLISFICDKELVHQSGEFILVR
ncbi:MAG: gliding motility-associated C-terminal domain-containing protein [Chitinophagaceae bacterium]|nr:gliding motility-associated C-terminal domain-containing protein [Chitinophagaceae bacterium]